MSSTIIYEDKLVVFVDILGFRQMVDKTVSDGGQDDEELISRIKHIFHVGKYFIEPDDFEEDEANVKVTWFSDSIVLSFNYKSESQIFHRIISLQWMLINFAINGVLCRGGVAKGKIIHGSDMVFGPALNEAYDLESNAAIYPRIIVPTYIVDLAGKYRKQGHSSDDEIGYVKRLLAMDGDGMYYIDYIGFSAQDELDDPEPDYPRYLISIYEILQSMRNIKNIRVRMKYEWLRRKYNYIIKAIHESISSGRYKPRDKNFLAAYSSLPME